MRKFFLAIFMIFLATSLLMSQGIDSIPSINPNEIEYFKLKPLHKNEVRVMLYLNFGGEEILNKSKLALLEMGKVKEVNLYFSAYPSNSYQLALNKKRIQNLMQEQKIGINSINIYKQTSCRTKSEALELFHGFEIILEVENFDFIGLKMDDSFNDFVVKKVLDRNAWTEMLIVSDLTGSMGPYISQLFIWLNLNAIDQKIKQFVFFNDGDLKSTSEKHIGWTGGIYHTRSKHYKEVEFAATLCMINGGGGDGPENDLEALQKGVSLCPSCKENILIVDNNSSVRDIELLVDITVPVRVILCGANDSINPEYLNIARKTKGSIHTIEEDIFNLIELNEGESIEVDKKSYTIIEGKFVRKKKT